MTPAELLAEAAACEDRAARHDAAAMEEREQAEAFRQLAVKAEERAKNTALTSSHIPSTVDDVSTTLSSNALRSQAQIAAGAKKHRLVAIMIKRGLSFADVATALEAKLPGRSFPRSTVQSWVKPKTDASYRGIPQDAADALKALYGVPLSAWARVIPA